MTRERVHSGRQGTPGLGLLRDLAGIALPAHMPVLLFKATAATPYACNAEMAYSRLFWAPMPTPLMHARLICAPAAAERAGLPEFGGR